MSNVGAGRAEFEVSFAGDGCTLDTEAKAALSRMQMREAERVWRLVVQASQGVAGGLINEERLIHE